MKHTKYPHPREVNRSTSRGATQPEKAPARPSFTTPKVQPEAVTAADPRARPLAKIMTTPLGLGEPMSASDTFLAAMERSLNSKATGIIYADTPADVAAVLKESFWGLCQLGKAIGELASACMEGDVEKASAVIAAVPTVLDGAERVFLSVAAHHGVGPEEVVQSMKRVHEALWAAYEAATMQPQAIA